MNEFLKINWRINDISELEPRSSFISEEVIADSFVYKYLKDKSAFGPTKKKTSIFGNNNCATEKNYINTWEKSVLDTWAHEHCLKALKLIQSGKDPSHYTANEKFDIDIFTKLKPKIIEENPKYQSVVFEQWNKKIEGKSIVADKKLLSFGQTIWENKWKQIVLYPRYYREMSTINTTFNENESIIDYKCVNNALEVGSVARFSHPNLTIAYHLAAPKLEKNNISATTVSQDENVTKIVQSYDIDIVLSYSSLKCISDTSNPNRKWMIPIVVKKMTTTIDDGSKINKNVVFLDKPFSQTDISHVDCAYMSYKRLIKTNFCRFEAFNYNDKESSLTKEEKNIQIHDANATLIHHNATYRIWSIKKTSCQNNLMKSNHKPVEFNVLIRSKVDACEPNEQGSLQPVILKPKLEMQLKFGANIPSKSELARDWTSLFFTPFSNLYRVRIAPKSKKVICIEKCSIQKVVSEAQIHYQYKPHMALGILQKVFEDLTHLQPGNYLLRHESKNGAFLSVMRETTESESKDSFDFHAEQDKISLTKFPKTWLPIDVNFILPSFEEANRMPGMFTPKAPLPKKRKMKQSKTKSKKNVA